MEKWLYFLQHAEHLEPGELASRLGDPAYLDAVGVLEMISRSPEDRQFYDARQKFIHDEEGRLLAARQEGREEGLEEGLEGQKDLKKDLKRTSGGLTKVDKRVGRKGLLSARFNCCNKYSANQRAQRIHSRGDHFRN